MSRNQFIPRRAVAASYPNSDRQMQKEELNDRGHAARSEQALDSVPVRYAPELHIVHAVGKPSARFIRPLMRAVSASGRQEHAH